MQTETPALVSIGILAFNEAEVIVPCIEAVQAQTWPNIELVVLDNASSDKTLAVLRERFPDLRVLANAENAGYARGHNRLIAETSGRFYMPLTPDVLLEPGFVAALAGALEADPGAGWATGKLYFVKQSGERTRDIYTTGHEILVNGVAANRGYGRLDEGQFEVQEEVFGANGAAPLYRRAMLEDVRMAEGEYFDRLFFVYGSDIELDWRARLLGWRCLFVPAAQAFHEHGQGNIRNPVMIRQYIARRYLMVFKCAFARDLWRTYVPMALGDFCLALARRRWNTVAALFSVLGDLPEVLGKRRLLRSRRRARREDVLRWFRPGPRHVVYDL